MGLKRRNRIRDNIVQAARLHAVYAAVSAMRFPGTNISRWKGDEDEGSYYFNPLTGHHLQIVWSREALVGLAFDHESERSEYTLRENEREPMQWVRARTNHAKSLARSGAAVIENLVTCAFWIEGKGGVRLTDSISRLDHGLLLLHGFLSSPKNAASGGGVTQGWDELFSLTAEQSQVVRMLAREAPTTVRATEKRILVGEAPIGEDAVNAAATALRDLGISWESSAAADREPPRGGLAIASLEELVLYAGPNWAVPEVLFSGRNLPSLRILEIANSAFIPPSFMQALVASPLVQRLETLRINWVSDDCAEVILAAAGSLGGLQLCCDASDAVEARLRRHFRDRLGSSRD